MIPEELIMLSCIDNLVRGASGQAIQNMNIMLGLDETTGLNHFGLNHKIYNTIKQTNKIKEREIIWKL